LVKNLEEAKSNIAIEARTTEKALTQKLKSVKNESARQKKSIDELEAHITSLGEVNNALLEEN
jgi:hypothetical protein